MAGCRLYVADCWSQQCPLQLLSLHPWMHRQCVVKCSTSEAGSSKRQSSSVSKSSVSQLIYHGMLKAFPQQMRSSYLGKILAMHSFSCGVWEVSRCETGGKPCAHYWFLIAGYDKRQECRNTEQKVMGELLSSRVLCMPSLMSVICDQCHWMHLSNKMPKCQHFIKMCCKE